MQKSETVGKLAEALSKAQGEMKPAKFDAVNPFFKSKYSSLGEIVESAKAVLAKHGLSVIQTVAGDVENVVIETMLAHSSGEWVSNSMAIKPVKADPQGIGSVITYGRRYCYASIIGQVSDEDTDANSVDQQRATEPRKTASDVLADEPFVKTISDKQAKMLFAKATSKGIPHAELKALIKGICNVEHSNEIPASKLDIVLKAIDGYELDNLPM